MLLSKQCLLAGLVLSRLNCDGFVKRLPGRSTVSSSCSCLCLVLFYVVITMSTIVPQLVKSLFSVLLFFCLVSLYKRVRFEMNRAKKGMSGISWSNNSECGGISNRS